MIRRPPRSTSTDPLFPYTTRFRSCFVFCYWAWNTLVRILPAGISGLSTQMIPVVGVFSSMVVLGEQPQWPEFAALALGAVALGLILKPARAQTVEAARLGGRRREAAAKPLQQADEGGEAGGHHAGIGDGDA